MAISDPHTSQVTKSEDAVEEHTSAVWNSVSVRHTSAVMKSDGAVDEAQTSAVTKSLSDGMDGNDEKDAAGDLEVTYADEPDDELDGCNNGVSEDTLGSLRGGLEETDDGVGVGLLLVLLVHSLVL